MAERASLQLASGVLQGCVLAQAVAGRAVECRENVPPDLDAVYMRGAAALLLTQASSWQYVMQSRL